MYVILRVVDNLKTILAPILPHTAQKLHEYLGYEGQLFGTQHVVEYQEETRSPPGADLRPQRRHRHLGAERTAAGAGAAPAGAALQEAGRERDRGGVRAAGRMRGE